MSIDDETEVQEYPTVEELKRALGHKGDMCFCPAHDDRNTPNLSVDLGRNGRPVFHCFAGCAQEDVLAALREQGWWPGAGAGSPNPPRTGLDPDADDRDLELDRLERAAKIWLSAAKHRKKQPEECKKVLADYFRNSWHRSRSASCLPAAGRYPAAGP